MAHKSPRYLGKVRQVGQTQQLVKGPGSAAGGGGYSQQVVSRARSEAHV